jgi:hypothetical protein
MTKSKIKNNTSYVLDSVEKFDLEKNIWITCECLNTARKGFCAVMMPDGIYCLGGYDGINYLNSVEKFDFNSKRWKNVPPMNFAKCHFSCVTSNDYQYIYTLGGYDGRSLAYIERFDIISNKWEILEKLPNPNYRHQSIYVNE